MIYKTYPLVQAVVGKSEKKGFWPFMFLVFTFAILLVYDMILPVNIIIKMILLIILVIYNIYYGYLLYYKNPRKHNQIIKSIEITDDILTITTFSYHKKFPPINLNSNIARLKASEFYPSKSISKKLFKITDYYMLNYNNKVYYLVMGFFIDIDSLKEEFNRLNIPIN